MAISTKIFFSESNNPWFNLAYEEQLVQEVAPDEIYLYLWQNQHTVVIGKHQNPWREVLLSELEAEGGKLARRLSGGGAVYHDLGNLNFTFVMNRDHEDLHRQLKVIVDGLKVLGIEASFSGRNDILAEGRKFSGNAFYYGRENYYHHGTILVDVDMTKLGRYLNVSMKKLNAKGVQSVKSRVINLKEINSEITIDKVKAALAAAFEAEYGTASEHVYISERTVSGSAQKRHEHYASWEWRIGRTPEFDVTLEEKFEWGEVVFNFKLRGAVIEESAVYSDAMTTDLVDLLQGIFDGKRMMREELVDAVKAVKGKSDASIDAMLDDIANWLDEQPI
ncbi:MAG: lipoate---protein ligase [Clostridiales bacterium]|jgi:lipoate-protein ligase A|nr:lipoate---protein ligase [Clostridiales bacterium]